MNLQANDHHTDHKQAHKRSKPPLEAQLVHKGMPHTLHVKLLRVGHQRFEPGINDVLQCGVTGVWLQ
jgi:hypothetical protein